MIKMYIFILALSLTTLSARILPDIPKKGNDLGPDGYPKDKLLMVEALWRHGDRAPLYFFETKLHKRPVWEVTKGNVFPDGLKQQEELGKWIRRRYVDHFHLLNKKLNVNELKIMATEYNRSIHSAEHNLFGMYGNDGLSVPLIVPPVVRDFAGNPTVSCTRLKSIIKRLLPNTPELQKLELKNKELFEQIEKIVVEPKIKCSIANMDLIWDQLICQRRHNNDVDPFMNELWDQIDSVYVGNYNLQFGFGVWPISDSNGKEFDISLQLRRVYGGYLLERMIGEFKKKIDCLDKNNCSSLKYSALSAHEITIGGLFSVLDLPRLDYDRDRLSDPCSAVFLELWENGEDGSHYVKVVYFRNAAKIMDITDGISGCDLVEGRGCTWESFVKRSEKYFPGEDKELCLRSIETDKDYSFTPPKFNFYGSIKYVNFTIPWEL